MHALWAVLWHADLTVMICSLETPPRLYPSLSGGRTLPEGSRISRNGVVQSCDPSLTLEVLGRMLAIQISTPKLILTDCGVYESPQLNVCYDREPDRLCREQPGQSTGNNRSYVGSIQRLL
jgi:hypothetical protein